MKHIFIKHPKVKKLSPIKIKLRKIFKIGIIIMIILTIYSFGIMRGMILGISYTQQKHNETLCDFMGKQRDTDEFCLLSNQTHKYRWYIDCGYEKFKLEGNQTPPFILKYTEYGRKVLYYPVLGC